MLKYDIRTGVKKIKTKTALIISGVGLTAAGAVLAVTLPFAAKAAGTTWQLNTPSQLTFVCSGAPYIHTLNSVSENLATGDFTGTGSYNPDSTYTWNVSGNIDGNSIGMTVLYTGTGAGNTYVLNGTIAADGSISGSSNNNCETFSMPSGTAVQTNQVIVTPYHTQGWSTDDTRPGGAVNFFPDVTAPGSPHQAALQLTTDATTTSKAQYMHSANAPLSSVNNLSYYTKQNSASFPGGDVSYQLPVCLGGVSGSTCNGFTTFVYEPYENGTVTPGSWQYWDVVAGQMWSSRSYVNGGCSVTAGGGGAPFYTLSSLKTNCPDAIVVGFGVNIGSNNPSYDVEADLVNFNGTTYNFEPDTNVRVQIFKYVDGVQATAVNTNSTTFPMVTTFNSPNLGSVTNVPFTLSPAPWGGVGIPYEADFVGSVTGADYTASEVTIGNAVVGTSCSAGVQYALQGYSVGDTLAQAQGATKTLTAPQFTNLQSDHVMIVWNTKCPPVLAHPTNKDQCKNDGWQTLADVNNRAFKNQGDCVSYVATNGKNKANG